MGNLELGMHILKGECDFRRVRILEKTKDDPDLQSRVRRYLARRTEPGADSLDFRGADLQHLDGPNWMYAGTRFGGANVSGANLENATLMGCLFDNARMIGANLTGAYLGCCEFVKSPICDIDFRQVRLHHCVFDRCAIDGSKYVKDAFGLESCRFHEVLTTANFASEVIAQIEDSKPVDPKYILVVSKNQKVMNTNYVLLSTSDESFIK